MSPAESLDLLEKYSVLILPTLVVAEQVGVPLPAVPALLGVGALAAAGRAASRSCWARSRSSRSSSISAGTRWAGAEEPACYGGSVA